MILDVKGRVQRVARGCQGCMNFHENLYDFPLYNLYEFAKFHFRRVKKAECLFFSCFTFSKGDRATKIDYFDKEVSPLYSWEHDFSCLFW